MLTREFHDIANIFPLMTSDEFEELCDDIREHGQQLPIVLLDEKILDGRNRYLVCDKLGIEPEFVTYTGNTPIEYAISANLKRRNLTVGQKSMIVEKSLPLFERQAAKRQWESRSKPGEKVGSKAAVNKPSPTERGKNAESADLAGKSADLAGKSAGVSGTSVKRAKKLRETASPEVIAAVESGEMTLNEAVEITEAKKPELDDRQKLLKDLDATIGKAVRLVGRIGINDAKGAKAYDLLDQICKLFAGWK